MSRRSSCQKMIMIAYFGFQNGCLQTRRREKEKQRRTRAAQQRESSVRYASQRKPSMQIWRSEIGYGAHRKRAYRYASSTRVTAIAMIRYCGSGVIGLCG